MAETVLNQQEQKLGDGADTQRPNNHLKKITGIVLSFVMVALTIYVLNLQHQNFKILSQSTNAALSANEHAAANYRTYVGKYKDTKIELDETTQKLVVVKGQLDQVSAQLATTQGMLAQTQGMLSQAQQENTALKQELQGFGNTGDLQSKIQALKDRDSQVSAQLADLKNELHAFQADFSNFDEGRALIVLFQNKIRLVKSRMHYLKQEAFYAKVAAQKEKDRMAVLNGNSGFVLRDGKVQNPDGTRKSFAIDVKIVQ